MKLRSNPRVKRFWLRLAVLAGLSVVGGDFSRAADMVDHCATPPFLTVKGERPNIMLFIDNGATMGYAAYAGVEDYDYRKEYIGYFDATKCYQYSTTDNAFYEDAIAMSVAGYCPGYSGNFMNWAYMTRFEVLKHALVGGRVSQTGGRYFVEGEPYTMIGVSTHSDVLCFNWNPGLYNGAIVTASTKFFIRRRVDKQLLELGDTCTGGGGGIFWSGLMRVEVPTEPTGVVHTLGVDQARWALAGFPLSEKVKSGEREVSIDGPARILVPYGHDPVNEPDNQFNLVHQMREMMLEGYSGASGNSAKPIAAAYHDLVKYHALSGGYYKDSALDSSDVKEYTKHDAWWE